MDSLGIALLTVGIGLVLSSFVYTFLVSRDVTNKMEELDRLWGRTADEMRKSRDDQLSTLRADAMAAISANNVGLYEQKLHVATNYATTKMQEQMEARFAAMIGKVETKVDRLTDLVKNGSSRS